MSKHDNQREQSLSASTPDKEDDEETECLNEEAGKKIVKDYNTLIPDGGWGWYVVLGSLVTHIIIGGIERSAGVLYLRFYDRFGESAAFTSWVTSIPSALRLMFGPLCSALAQRYSCRTVVIGGAIFFALTMLISAFATDLLYLLITFGIVGGFARSFVYAPAVMIVAMYFNKKRGIAAGISTSGVGVGTFALPPLVEVLFEFYGFGAFFILTGIVLNLCICGALFRPLSFQRKLIAFDDRQKLNSEISSSEKKEEELIFLSKDCVDIEIKIPEQPRKGDNCPLPLGKSTGSCNSYNQDSGDTSSTSSETDTQSTGVLKKSSLLHRMCSCFKTSKDDNGTSSNCINVSILADLRFLTFCIAILLFTLAFQSAFVFLPAYGRQVGASDIKSAMLIVVTGVADGVGRILSGIILDLKRVKKYRVIIYNIIMFIVGAVSFVIPSITSYVQLCVVCGVYGLLIGAYISQKSVIVVDLLGPEKILSSFGILICFQGFGMLIGPPLSGFLKDINGKYDYAFYVGGIAMYVGAIILTFGNVLHAFRNRRSKAKNKGH